MTGRPAPPPQTDDRRRELRVVMVVLAVLFLVWLGDVIYRASAEALAAYVGTLFATFAGVAGAAYLNVREFDRQERKRNGERSDLLAQSLAGELSTVQDILEAPPNVTVVDHSGRGRLPIPLVLAHLEPTATEEAIRAGLMGAQSSANLGQLSNMVRDYSKACDNLNPLVSQMRISPSDPNLIEAAYPLASEIDRLKQNLLIWCKTVLDGLESQGVTMPADPSFRTNPGYVVQHRPGGAPSGPPSSPPGPSGP